jgi:superfamily I DNA/RNA helicase/mRNA-degrading endonuclease RelE of RelBE toxin-antitoxin system
MEFLITHKPAYDTDFIDLPKDLQERATRAKHEIAAAPNTVRGNTIKPLRGWDNVWRYRLGDYRLIYAIAPDNPIIQLLAIGPRGSVYERFNFEGWDSPDAQITFSSQLAGELAPQQQALPDWLEHPEWFRPAAKGNQLPRKLTPALLARWLIPKGYHEPLMRCLTDDDLLAADVPPEILGRVMDALWPPPAEKLAQQPDQLLIRPEDMKEYAAGTLRGFLLHLDENQRRFTDWALSGPTLVKGGPGSGKSTVALYRVRTVIEHTLEEQGRQPEVLFTTYTNALINFSQSLLQQLLADPLELGPGDPLPKSVRVSTVDKIVMWIARSSGRTFELAEQSHCLEALRYARAAVKPRQLGDLEQLMASVALQKLRDDYLLEEFDWVIEGQNCRQLDHYLAANRAGRAIPLDQKARSAVWQLYGAYNDYLAGQERLTWGHLRQLALDEVKSGRFEKRWDSVIVDEAQDLTPAAIALCVELCRDPAGLFLTADANQSLYNHGFRWGNVHDQLKVVGRTRILRRNYRTTRQIAQAAAELLAPGDPTAGKDDEALQQEYLHSGYRPVIFAAESTDDQARWLAEQIYQAARDLRLPINAAAILVPSNSLGRNLAERIADHGLPVCFMSSREVNLDERCVKVMTLHAAKGLEFPIVAVAHVEADRLPKALDSAEELDIREHMDQQQRLFFVGCTRAMRYLFVTHDRWLASPFLDQLSDDLWQRVK